MKLKKFSSTGYVRTDNGSLQVGDVVVVKHNYLGTVHIYEIDEITKTMAKCKCENYVHRFRLDIKWIKSLPADTWDNNQYIVYRKIQGE